MKKVIITIFMVFMTIINLSAQQGKREKLKAYKTAYITEHLDLTPQEAEKFWPVYNAYEKQIYKLKVLNIKDQRKQIVDKGGIEEISNEEADQIIDKLMKNEQAILKVKKDLFNNLEKVLSSKKLLKLYSSEHDFNRKLLSEYRKKKMMNQNNMK